MTLVPTDYERIVQEVYEAVLRPGDSALDIGAHLGRHTISLARCVGPEGKVLAVEPLPACREELRQRLAEVGRELASAVRLFPFALSDQPGLGSLTVAEEHPAFSGLRQVPYPSSTATRIIPVEIETLDRQFCDLDALHFIKLDAEGAELHILRGGTACLNKFRPVVGFEFGTFSNREYDIRPEDMARFWDEKNYHIYAITGQRLDKSDFVACAEKRDIWDYVAVPAEKSTLDRQVRESLDRPRVNWLAVRAQLNHARDHAEVGATVPPLRRCRGPLRPVARGLARLFLLAARIITIPQRLFNNALLLALGQLTTDLEECERACQRRDRRIQELEQRLEILERNVTWLDEPGKRGCVSAPWGTGRAGLRERPAGNQTSGVA